MNSSIDTTPQKIEAREIPVPRQDLWVKRMCLRQIFEEEFDSLFGTPLDLGLTL